MSGVGQLEARAAVGCMSALGEAVRWCVTTGWLVWGPMWLVVSLVHSVVGQFLSLGVLVWGVVTAVAWGVWVVRRRRQRRAERAFFAERWGDSPMDVWPLLADFEELWPDTAYFCGLTVSDDRRPGLTTEQLAANSLQGYRIDRLHVSLEDSMAGDAATRVVPEILRISPTDFGFDVEFSMIPGQTADAWCDAAGALATSWGVERVGVEQVGPQSVRVRAMAVDPLESTMTLLEAREAGLASDCSYDSVPVAISDEGQAVRLSLFETSTFIGGMPGSGKSGTLTAIMAQVATLENAVLVGIDPKLVELAEWGPRFTRLVTDDPDEIDELIRDVYRELKWRQKLCADAGMKKIEVCEYTPLIVFVIDEITDVFRARGSKADKGRVKERIDLVCDIIRLGRAFGVSVICATQRPASTQVPTDIRDICDQRVGLRTATSEVTKMIMGRDPNSAPSHTISARLLGTGWWSVLTVDDPVRARTFWVPDEDVPLVASATSHLRWSSMSGAGDHELDGGSGVELEP